MVLIGTQNSHILMLPELHEHAQIGKWCHIVKHNDT